MALTPEQKEEWISVLGEGIHTGFRKGTDHPRSHEYWILLAEMPGELWDDVLSWTVWALEYSGMIGQEAE